MEENKSYCIVPADVANEEKHMLFRIPLYQRLFAWSPYEVNQLMEDLKNHFKKHEKDSKKYYLGMLTVVKQDGFRLKEGDHAHVILPHAFKNAIQQHLRHHVQVRHHIRQILYKN